MLPIDDTGGMDAVAQATSDRTDKALSAREAALFALPKANLDALRPQISPADQATFEQLIRVLGEATARNESIAQIRERVTQLGEGAVRLVARIADLV